MKMGNRYFDHGDSFEDLTMRFNVPTDGAGKRIPHFDEYNSNLILLALPCYERRIPMGYGGLNKVMEMYPDFSPLFHRAKIVLLVNESVVYVKKNRITARQFTMHREEFKKLDILIEGADMEELLDPACTMSFVSLDIPKIIQNSSISRRKLILLT